MGIIKFYQIKLSNYRKQVNQVVCLWIHDKFPQNLHTAEFVQCPVPVAVPVPLAFLSSS